MKLDLSHRTIIEHYGTFQQAQRCFDEINQAILGNLQTLVELLSAKHATRFQFVVRREGGSIYIQTSAFADWLGSGHPLINLGAENFSLDDLLGSASGEGCRAYIFSELLSDPSQAQSLRTLSEGLCRIPPPDGFSPAPSLKWGYLFMKKLGPLSADVICSADDFRDYFHPVFTGLIDWVVAQSVDLAALPSPGAVLSRAKA